MNGCDWTTTPVRHVPGPDRLCVCGLTPNTYAVVTTKLRGCGLTFEEAQALAATLIGAEIWVEVPRPNWTDPITRYRDEERERAR